MAKRELRKLIASVRETKRSLQPDAAWKQANREVLLSHVRETLPSEAPNTWSRIKSLIHSLVPEGFAQAIRGPVFASISIAVVVLGGSMASVNASVRSLPGDWLYPIKIVTEQTRLVLTTDKTERLRLKMEFIERRLQEIKSVAADAKKPNLLIEAADGLRRDLDTVKLQLAEITKSESSRSAVEAAKLLDQKSTEIARELRELKQTLSEEAQAAVSDAQVAAANTGVKAVEVLLEKKDMPDTEGAVSDEELTESITNKVEALSATLMETSEKLNLSVSSSTLDATSTQSAVVPVATATTTEPATSAPVAAPTTSSTIFFANMTLLEARQLLEQNELDLIPEKLLSAIKAMKDAEELAAKAEAEKAASEPSVEPTFSSSTDPVPEEPADSSSTSTSNEQTPTPE